MNTKQKLTLGIAAIFMVTLTIVGVTYAYFVTRVSGDGGAKVEVSTANVGSVKYEVGNGTSDTVTLNDVLPGTTIYKSFKVKNDTESVDATLKFSIYYDATTTANTAQFVHATATDECYKSTAKPSNDAAPTASCFDAAAYNNVKVTLYEVTNEVFGTVQNDGTITNAEALTNTIYAEAGVKVATGTTAGTVTQDLATDIQIAGGAYKYYVLKVDYQNADANQNIENEAALTLKVNIK